MSILNESTSIAEIEISRQNFVPTRHSRETTHPIDTTSQHRQHRQAESYYYNLLLENRLAVLYQKNYRSARSHLTSTMMPCKLLIQLILVLNVVWSAVAFAPSSCTSTNSATTAISPERSSTARHAALTVPGMWGRGLNFGKGDFTFYRNFDSFMKPFSQEDRGAFPEVFNLPKGVYEVVLTKPLGIIFEEIEAGKGVFVQDLVEDGLAARQGKIQPGDVLVGVTAVKIVGAKWERRLIPARNFDFDTAVGAIGSNEPKWGCNDVVLMFERPGESDPKAVDEFLEFFEPPFDSPCAYPSLCAVFGFVVLVLCLF